MEAGQPFEYTLNMEKIFQGTFLELKSYYCREDFELVLDEYDKAPEDAKKFRTRDLARLCDARGIDVKYLLENRDSVLESISDRKAIQNHLLESFHEMYANSPSTSDFMERIVRRLAPEYSSDTVRTAILKKFVIGGGKNFKRFRTDLIWKWAENRLSEEETAVYRKASDEEKKKMLLMKADDSIFEYSSVELTAEDVLNIMIGFADKCQKNKVVSFEGFELSGKTADSLALMLPEDEGTARDDVMNGLRLFRDLIRRRCVRADDAALSGFAASLEKDFREYLKTIKCVSKTGMQITAADLYKQAKKDAKKAKAAAAKKNEMDSELLGMCNDLAAGNFRVNGRTKVYLYYFAFMFDMTLPLEGRVCEPERDIVKNLFQDFYNDNFMRLLSTEYADSKNSFSIEKEPTGEGINYKSFVEMIYLYYLCRDGLDMTPGEKIDHAEAVISECVKRARKTGRTAQAAAGMHTAVYREKHLNVLLNKEPDEIVDYILSHYQVYLSDNNRITRIMISSEENTASDLIEEIMDDMDEVYPDLDLFGALPDSELTGKSRKRSSSRLNLNLDWAVKQALEEKYADDINFLKVLKAIDSRTHVENGRFNKNERERMLNLLHVLAVHSSEKKALSRYKLRSHLEAKGVLSAGDQISDSLRCLHEIGFDVCREKDSYYLGKRKYGDELLDSILDRASGIYFSIDNETDLSMAKALICRQKSNKRVTRSELIAIHFNYYIVLLNDTQDLDTFPQVFEDYASTIDPILEEARFQPLSEKNIFDMYIVTVLYFYLVENYGYA